MMRESFRVLSPEKIAIVERAHRARADYIAGLAASLAQAARRALRRLGGSGNERLTSRAAGLAVPSARRKRR
jgi:hypothetical protein